MARVLIAEPDRRIREFVAGILSDCGHVVETCANGAEATARLGTGSVDVLVSDLLLGRREGAILGQNCAVLGIPTLSLSGCEFRAGQSAWERPTSLLEKPFRFADLRCVLDAVERRSRSGRPGSPITQDAA